MKKVSANLFYGNGRPQEGPILLLNGGPTQEGAPEGPCKVVLQECLTSAAPVYGKKCRTKREKALPKKMREKIGGGTVFRGREGTLREELQK